MTTYDVTLLSQHEVAEGTHEFILEKPEGFTYRAGQFGELKLPASGDFPGGAHAFSFVTAPHEKDLRMATRMRGSDFKNALRDTADGSTVQLEGPIGGFTLHNKTSVPAVFVIGGIGITPIHSMIVDALHENTSHDLTLIYSNKNAGLAAFEDELETLAEKHDNFHFVPVHSDDHGFVDADVIKKHVPDLEAPRYYLAGPAGMVTAMRELLIDVGADEDDIRTEEFSGY